MKRIKITAEKQALKSLSIVFLTGLMLFPAISQQLNQDLPITVNRLSPRVCVFNFQGGMHSNIIAVNSEKGIAVIDAEISPLIAAGIRRRIEQEFPGKNIAYLINTHHHGDHTYGNQIFSDAVIIGHQSIISGLAELEDQRTGTIKQLQAITTQMQNQLAEMDKNSPQAKAVSDQHRYYDLVYRGLKTGFRLTPPTLTFRERLDLNLGDLTLQIQYFGHAHSSSDTFIYCPEEEILMTGDTFFPGNLLYVDTERIPHMPRWEKNLEWLTKSETGIKYIIPGHEEFIPFTELALQLDHVKERQRFFQGKSSGLTIFRRIYEDSGAEAAGAKLKELQSRPDTYFLLHAEIDSYVYRLMLNGKLNDAAVLFEAVAAVFPDKANAFDSLGEVYRRIGDHQKAISNFEKSLELNPENRNAAAQLKALKEKK